jgi:NAD(P)-dependent dehydrogenase (short-subunit alcohol dehydrogenase family)
MIDFTGQAVIVTGAGRGLGRLYALDIARRGGQVVVNDIGGTIGGDGSDPRVADEVVEEIRRAGGAAVASYESVASPEGGQAIVETALERFGRLDAVISNAGILQTVAFDQIAPADWRRMLSVHLDGGFYLSQPAFKAMKAQGYGRFVFISSSAGAFGQPQLAHYAAAKAGLIGLSNVIAIEGAPHGILANTVLPFAATRMVDDQLGGPEAAAASPVARAIPPGLVVPIVVFLASRACAFTHHNYSAGAGRYARAFMGVGEGWLAPLGTQRQPTAEDIEARLDEVSATAPFIVPMNIYEEMDEIRERRAAAAQE